MSKEINNCLQYYIDLLRGKKWSIMDKELNNIINTMRIARHDKICGEDFSEIDWGNISFNGIHFSDNGKNPSEFNNSIIRNQSIFSGHCGRIFFAQWSDDDKYIATWGFDGKIIIWDIETKSIKEEIEAYEPINTNFDWYLIIGYPDFVFDILPDKDNFIIKITKKYLSKYVTIKKLPSISRDSEINLTFRELLRNRGVDDNYKLNSSICYLTDNKEYAIVSWNNGSTPYWIVDLKTLETISETYNYIGISEDKKQYFAVDNSWNVKVFDLKSNKLIMNIMPHKREIDSVGFLSDNTQCYSLCLNLSSSVDESLIIWDFRQKRMVKKLYGYKDHEEIKRIIQTSLKIQNLEYIGYEDENWDRYDGIKLIAKDNSFDIVCIGYEYLSYHINVYTDHQSKAETYIREHILSATLSINEDYFIFFTLSSEIVFWEISTQSEKKRIPLDCCRLENSRVSSSCFSPDGNTLLIGFENGAVHAVDSKTGETICRMEHLAFLFVDGCSFKNSLMDEEIKKVIFLHGGSFD